MEYLETFEKFAQQDNCKGCGAPLDPKKEKCDRSGYPYKVKLNENLSTVPEGLKNTVYNFSHYHDFEETIKHFFRCSLYNSWDKFNFRKAFKLFNRQIEQKLAEHGQLDYDSFAEIDKEYNQYSEDSLLEFTTKTDYINIDESDLLEVIVNYRYERFNETFSEYDSYITLKELYYKIDNYNDSDELGYKIQLFDSIIHAQHETGDIFEDINPDDLREEVNEEYNKYKKRTRLKI